MDTGTPAQNENIFAIFCNDCLNVGWQTFSNKVQAEETERRLQWQIMRSSWDHHEIIMRSSWDHHEIIMRSSWDHKFVLSGFVKGAEQNCGTAGQGSNASLPFSAPSKLSRVQSSSTQLRHLSDPFSPFSLCSCAISSLADLKCSETKLVICCNCWILTALVERCGKYHRFSDHCTDSCNPAQVRELIKMSQPHLVYWTHRKYKIGLLSWRFACSVLFWHHIIYV
jgi:hypothetical protein